VRETENRNVSNSKVTFNIIRPIGLKVVGNGAFDRLHPTSSY